MHQKMNIGWHVIKTHEIFYFLFVFPQSLVVDQVIEKVSFCTPDPNDEKLFSYICRDGTTRRWMCHSFRGIKDTVSTHTHSLYRH